MQGTSQGPKITAHRTIHAVADMARTYALSQRL